MQFNEPLKTAQQLYRGNGGDFSGDPKTFLMGYFFREDDPKHPTPLEGADGVFVVLCAGEPKPALCQLVDLVSLVGYERAFRGDDRVRILDIKKYYSKL